MITFRRGKTKVWVPTHPQTGTGKKLMPLYAESVNMLEGLTDEEVDQYLEKNPKIVPLFEIDVAEVISPYIAQPEDAVEEPYTSSTGDPGMGNGGISKGDGVPT